VTVREISARRGCGLRVELVDASLAAGLTAVSLAIGTAPSGPLGWVAGVAVYVPLIWRRGAPLLVFWSVVVLSIFSLYVLDVPGPYPLFAPLLALYSVARYNPRWHSLVLASLAGTALGVGWAAGGLTWEKFTALASVAALTVLVGTNLRIRGVRLEEARERQRQAAENRDQQLRLLVAAERQRIAQEIHDIVAHSLAVMVALADGAALTIDSDPDRAAVAIGSVAVTGRQALDEMQHVIELLRGRSAGDGLDGPQPDLGNLAELVDQMRSAGLQVSVTRRGEAGQWGPGAGLAVYRVVQEALTNVLKHAGPTAWVSVTLTHRADEMEIDVVDDGGGRGGCGEATGGGGHGLVGMAERVGAYGGVLEVGPQGRGWRVKAMMVFGPPS
jgi:signal transduction histidine kinase